MNGSPPFLSLRSRTPRNSLVPREDRAADHRALSQDLADRIRQEGVLLRVIAAVCGSCLPDVPRTPLAFLERSLERMPFGAVPPLLYPDAAPSRRPTNPTRAAMIPRRSLTMRRTTVPEIVYRRVDLFGRLEERRDAVGLGAVAFGTVLGLTPQCGSLLAVAQTPNWKSCGVGWKPRAWSELKPSWPVSTTVKPQPDAGVPSAAFGTRERDVARDRVAADRDRAERRAVGVEEALAEALDLEQAAPRAGRRDR